MSGKNGILVSASGVTIDLNAFNLLGVAGSLNGIRSLGLLANITIINGSVRSWGGAGIDLTVGGPTFTGRLSELRLRDNGGYGLAAGIGFTIDSCVSIGNGTTGILAFNDSTIHHCVSNGNGSNGIYASDGVVSECVVNDNAADGISGGGVAKISNCSLERNGGNGIVASERSAITNNTVFGSAVVGIKVSSNCVVSGNFCVQANGASGVGISATGFHNRITGTMS